MFALTTRGAVHAEIARLFEHELEVARSALASPAQKREEGVHEARKALKRLRALLRLVDDALPVAVVERENAAFRAVARSLGVARDRTAVKECLQKLFKEGGEGVRAVLADQMSELFAGLDAGAPPDASVAKAMAIARDALTAAAERARDFPDQGRDFSSLARGLRKTYRRGRRSFERALHHDSAENWHSFRTDAKRLQYQLELLEPIFPGPLKAFRKEASELGDLLGHDHDLTLLEALLPELAGAARLATLVAPLGDALAERHAELRRQATDLAMRLYAESPKRFGRRHRIYLDAWLDEGSRSRASEARSQE